jgi:4-amino-4-deoxy-L-arabinose transferase-like glycosyltransferase
MRGSDIAPARCSPVNSVRPSNTTLARPFLGGWFLLVPIVIFSATRELWAPDEPRYAQIAREAWERGSFFVLHLCGELYPDKPPLVYWLAGVCGRLTGWSEFALRIPSLLATIGTAWITLRLARRFLGELEAAWSVPFVLGTVMMLEIGGRLQLDPVLTCLCLAALDLLSNTEGGASAIRQRTLLAGLATGIAALAKGPPAWIHVGFAVLAWIALPQCVRLAPRRSWPVWLGFVALALAPVAIWAALAIRREPALAEPLLFGQHIGRITTGDKHPGPVWDHVKGMLGLFFPWTLLVVAGLARAWRGFVAARRGDSAEIGLVRTAAWFALVFVFFSVIPPKRALYLLPIYPAAALIAAREFAIALRAGRLAGWIGWTTAFLLAVAGLAITGASFAPVEWITRVVPASPDEFLAYRGTIAPCGLLLAAGGLVALYAQRRGRPGLWANALSISMAAALASAALWLVPRVNDVKSARSLARILAERPERPTLIPCVGIRPEGIRFYGGVPAAYEPIPAAIEREGAQFLALCTEENYARLSEADRARVKILVTRQRGTDEVYVLGAR